MKKTIKKLLPLVLACFVFVSLNSFSVKAAGLSIGSASGNTYENEFFNLKLVLPSNFAFVSNEKLADESELSLEELNDPALAVEKINGGLSPFVAYAYDETEKNNVNISISAIDGYTEADLFAEVKDAMGGVYSEYGYDEYAVDVVDAEIMGEPHYKMISELKIGDLHIYQETVALLKDGYCITITASADSKDLAAACTSDITKLAK